MHNTSADFLHSPESQCAVNPTMFLRRGFAYIWIVRLPCISHACVATKLKGVAKIRGTTYVARYVALRFQRLYGQNKNGGNKVYGEVVGDVLQRKSFFFRAAGLSYFTSTLDLDTSHMRKRLICLPFQKTPASSCLRAGCMHRSTIRVLFECHGCQSTPMV